MSHISQTEREPATVKPLAFPAAHAYVHPEYLPDMLICIHPGVRAVFPHCACAGHIVEVTTGFYWDGGGVCGYHPDLVPVKYQRRIYSIPQQYVLPLPSGCGEERPTLATGQEVGPKRDNQP